LSRKERKDKIVDKVWKYILDFLLNDLYTRLDTKQKLISIDDPRTNTSIQLHKRIWRVANKKSQHILFVENEGRTVGLTVFRKVLKKFKKLVCNPLPESCVDKKVSNMEHYMAALVTVLRRKDFKIQLQNASYAESLTFDKFYEVLRKASVHQLVESVCCEKTEKETLWIDKSKPCPQFIPLKCTHGLGGDRQ
jgi:hypothetical protein